MDSVKDRGLLIVFEGVDRSGKTTQSKQLVENLKKNNIPAIHKSFPDRTTSTGTVINAYLQEKANQEDHAIHLLFSANRWEAKEAL